MIFTSGLRLPVSPVLLPDESWLVSEMGAEPGCVTHIASDGNTRRVVAQTGQPNGLAVDSDGIIWVANSDPPALLCLTLEGKIEEFLTACNGEPFLLPNDLVFGPDGALYLTDSGMLVADFAPGLKVRADFVDMYPNGRVYRIDVKTKEIKKLDSGIRFANGIAFGNANHLYVAETLNGMVYRYQWRDGELILPREKFCNVVDPAGVKGGAAGPVGPDGMKFGPDGLLYVAVLGQGHICVLGQDGAIQKRIRTRGQRPTNLAFGPPGSGRLYVSESEFGAIEVL